MNRRKMMIIAVAVIVGLGVIFMVRGAMAPKKPSGPEVLVAASAIPMGSFLQAQTLRWQVWSPEHITEAFIVRNPKGGQTVSGQDFVGAVARSGIKAGEPILRGTVVKPHDRGFLAAVLEPGMRAVAAPVTGVTGIAGFVFPGDRVDLILTHTMRASKEDEVGQRRASVTVVRNARVLALDQNASDAPTNTPKVAKVVTLEVDPKQAEVVTLALQLGTLSLSLRSIAIGSDGKPMAEPVGYESGRFTLDSDVSHLIPAPRDHIDISSEVVRVLRGKERTQTSFEQLSTTSSHDAIDESRDHSP
jgi:pilus assembly protein CpaB